MEYRNAAKLAMVEMGVEKRDITKAYFHILANHAWEDTNQESLVKMNVAHICGVAKETIEHLSFEYKYSRMCLNKLLQWLGKGVCMHDITGIWR